MSVLCAGILKSTYALVYLADQIDDVMHIHTQSILLLIRVEEEHKLSEPHIYSQIHGLYIDL